MYPDGAFVAEPSTISVSLSGLVSCVRRSGDRSPPLATAMCSRLLVAYSEGFARMALEQDRLERLCQTQLPLCGGPPWATGFLCAIIAAHSGATWGPAHPDVVPPWQLSRSDRVVWLPDDPLPARSVRHWWDLSFRRDDSPGMFRLVLQEELVLQWRVGNPLAELAVALEAF